MDKLIAPALAEIKPVYYPGEVKLVSLDVLKLYRGEDVVRQNPDDVDPDHYADEGDLTELPEIPLFRANVLTGRFESSSSGDTAGTCDRSGSSGYTGRYCRERRYS